METNKTGYLLGPRFVELFTDFIHKRSLMEEFLQTYFVKTLSSSADPCPNDQVKTEYEAFVTLINVFEKTLLKGLPRDIIFSRLNTLKKYFHNSWSVGGEVITPEFLAENGIENYMVADLIRTEVLISAGNKVSEEFYDLKLKIVEFIGDLGLYIDPSKSNMAENFDNLMLVNHGFHKDMSEDEVEDKLRELFTRKE